jgi:hypothetical protein
MAANFAKRKQDENFAIVPSKRQKHDELAIRNQQQSILQRVRFLDPEKPRYLSIKSDKKFIHASMLLFVSCVKFHNNVQIGQRQSLNSSPN